MLGLSSHIFPQETITVVLHKAHKVIVFSSDCSMSMCPVLNVLQQGNLEQRPGGYFTNELHGG